MICSEGKQIAGYNSRKLNPAGAFVLDSFVTSRSEMRITMRDLLVAGVLGKP